MKQLHAITGLPRAGTTLLRNILAQNPALHVSSTSPVLGAVFVLQQLLSKSDEVRSDLIADEAKAKARLEHAITGFVGGWYHDVGDRICFDSSRGWTPMASVHAQLFPSSVRLVCVRELRSVFASLEKQHLKFPLLDASDSMVQKTVADRARVAFSPEGLIGSAIMGVEDLLRRNTPNTLYLPYEWFAANPAEAMVQVYETLHMDPFGHTFDAVVNQATECDALWLGKFPHQGSGKVEPSQDNWADYCPADIAQEICDKFPFYNARFGYGASAVFNR